jgi:hypothetical protein
VCKISNIHPYDMPLRNRNCLLFASTLVASFQFSVLCSCDLLVFVLCLVCPVLLVSLHRPLLIAPSVFSGVYLSLYYIMHLLHAGEGNMTVTMLLLMWFLNVWDNVPMDLKYACQQYFTCMCFLGFIRYNKTFITCGFRRYENLFTYEYHIYLLVLRGPLNLLPVFGGVRVAHPFSFLCCVVVFFGFFCLRPVSCVPGVASFAQDT